MIPFTCPCCEVSAPPHRDGCTFHADCPTDAEMFDEVATLRASRLLTDDEASAVEEMLAVYRICQPMTSARITTIENAEKLLARSEPAT